MNINKLETPAILVDLDILDKNINKYHSKAIKNNKEIWPMTKTHKSTEIIKLQLDNGATGVLCGTLDECEAAAEIGAKNIMYAYPVSDTIAIDRIISLAGKSNFIIRIDDLKAAYLINNKAKEESVVINYTIIVDSGLNRFGIDKEDIIEFLDGMKEYENLVFKGISTHPGHVYGMDTREKVTTCSRDEAETLEYCYKELIHNGYKVEYISTGSTPTYFDNIENEYMNLYHPGNYVFNDGIQISLGIAVEEDCALTVLASIISNPRKGVYICDSGSKCLGLDKGAHGNASIIGYGTIIDHPDAILESLSEEVGKIIVKDYEEFKVGQRIRIIPNHSCSVANMTDYFYGVKNGNLDKVIKVDIRGNSKMKY